ncbi:MAG: TonB-dependent receptor [Amphiplicatus sp.]
MKNKKRNAIAASVSAIALVCAAEAADRTSGLAAADNGVAIQWNIPAQPLTDALIAWSEQSNYVVLIQDDLTAGIRSPELAGAFTSFEALERLLASSGLTYKIRNETTLVVTPRLQPASMTLPAETSNAASMRSAQSAETLEDRDDQQQSRPPVGDQQAANDQDQVVVTGTRIKGARPTSPVVTITQEDMRLQGQNNLGEVIRALPQNFAGGQNPGVAFGAAVGSMQGNSNATGSSALNLRGLGSDATLTLLNGSRLAYDGFGQAVDVSVIPVTAIERVEILLDGASAIYGSDAVGGVANIVLKRDYEGAELRARVGAATDGGYEQQQYTGVAGTNWSSGGFLITGDYSHNESVKAKHRKYLEHILNQNLTIYPEQTQKSALFSAHQEAGVNAVLRVDAFYADRSSDSTFQTSPSSLIQQERDSSIWGVTPSFEVTLPGDWSARLHGAFGRNEAVLAQPSFSVATGEQLSNSVSESFNGAKAAGLEAEGPVFTLPGGESRVSIGGGWRESSFDRRVVNVLTGSVSSELDAEESSYYVYGEANLPLVSEDQNIPLVERFTLNAALRYENYDSFGSATTPKIGALWRLAPGFDLKASWGRSFKVPTLFQRHLATSLTLRPAAQHGAVGAPADAQVIFFSSGGSPNLTPETAEIITAGFVAAPAFLPDFTLEFGWFDIDYANRVERPISVFTQALSDPIFAEFVILNPTVDEQNATFAASGLPVGTFTFNQAGAPYDPAKAIAIIDNRFTNVSSQSVQGVDLTARYRTDLRGGDLSLSVNGNWITEATRKLTDLAPVEPTAGVNFWPADFKGRLGAGWSRDGFTLNASLNHTAGIIDRGVTPNVKRDSMTTVDLVVDYQAKLGVVGDVGFNLAVTNLFNEAPPFLAPPIASIASLLVNYDSTNYSALGRLVSATVTKRF